MRQHSLRYDLKEAVIIEALHKVTRVTGPGIDPSYSNFVIDLDFDDSNRHGQMETRKHGPRLELSAGW